MQIVILEDGPDGQAKKLLGQVRSPFYSTKLPATSKAAKKPSKAGKLSVQASSRRTLGRVLCAPSTHTIIDIKAIANNGWQVHRLGVLSVNSPFVSSFESCVIYSGYLTAIGSLLRVLAYSQGPCLREI